MGWLIKAEEDSAAQINSNIDEAKPLIRSGIKSMVDAMGKVETAKGKTTPQEALDGLYTGLGDMWQVYHLLHSNKVIWDSYTSGKEILEKANPYDTAIGLLDNSLRVLLDYAGKIEEDISYEQSIAGGNLRTAPKLFTDNDLKSMREATKAILSALRPIVTKLYKLPLENELTTPGEPGPSLRRRHITEEDPRSQLQRAIRELKDSGKEPEPEIETEDLDIPGIKWIVKRQPDQMKRIPQFRKSIMKSVPTKITPWYERPQATK